MPILLMLVLVITQGASLTVSAILARYVQAMGGEAAMLAVTTRISEGEYDNGRGLNTTCRIVEEAPEPLVGMVYFWSGGTKHS